MALVRRTVPVARAALPSPATPIPRQGPGEPLRVPGTAVDGAMPAPPAGQEMAAAAPSKPAHMWAMVSGLAMGGLGALGAWQIGAVASPPVFQVSNQMSAFAALFVFSAAVERILEPFSRWFPGRTEQETYEAALAAMENGVGTIAAAATGKAAVDRARASRAVLMWGLANLLATLASAAGGFFLLRIISTDPTWSGVPTWIDALITGLVVGSGTKPLHDLVSRVQRQTNATPSV